MGSNHSRQRGGQTTSREEQEKRQREQYADLLYRQGVLIPPSFGTATDAFPPPSSSSVTSASGNASSSASCTPGLGLGVTSSAPHLVLSSHCLGLGPLNSDSGSGSVITSHLTRLPPYRLLSSEHLLRGLFVSASTPDGLGNVTAGWASAGNGGGATGGGGGDAGFLSGAVLLPTSPSASLSALSGIGGAVSTSSTTSDLAGHLGAFISRPVGGDGEGSDGQLTGYAYAAGCEMGGGGAASPTAGVGDASPPVLAENDGNINSTPDQRCAMTRLGWSYSRRLIPSGDNSNDWPSTEYYRNDPFAAKRQRLINNERNNSTLVAIGSSLLLKPSNTKAGEVALGGASSHVTVSSPKNGFEGAVEASLPVNIGSTSSLMEDIVGDKQDIDGNDEPKIDPLAIAESIKTVKPNLSGYISFDLNKVGGGGGDPNSNNIEEEMLGPPIMVTFHQLKANKTSEAAATVSQTFTFDRIVTNPLEDRCPKIRNTISWAVRLKRSVRSIGGYGPSGGDDANSNTGTTASVGGPTIANTALTAALAYQVNRGLCYKIQADSKAGASVGILLKRWAHPRITASVLFGTKESTGGVPLGGGRSGFVGFKGICLQVESGPLPSSLVTADPPGTVPADWLYGLAGSKQGGAGIAGETPATKAELPER